MDDYYYLGTTDYTAVASGSDAVITYTAVAGKAHVIKTVVWSYATAPASGGLKIEDGAGNTVLQVDITSAGPGFLPLDPGGKGNVNTALVVTLLNGTAAKKLTVLGHEVV